MAPKSNEITLEDIKSAIEKRDPAFIEKFNNFMNQPDPSPPENAPEGSMSFYDLRSQLTGYWNLYKYNPGEERMQYRNEVWAKYLAQEFPLPPRLYLDSVFLDLYEEDHEWGRQTLLRLISSMQLKWGPWRAFKRIFKIAEQRNDYEMLGAIASRMDTISAANEYGHEVTTGTTSYLRRRGWRFLRRVGQGMPSIYPYAASQFMRWYPDWNYDNWSDKTKLTKLWILNHIFFHNHKNSYEGRQYGRASFNYGTYWNEMPTELTKHSAFSESWKTSPEPLLDLLLLCRADRVAKFCIEGLQTHFKARLRELDLQFLIRLGQRPLGTVQSFVMELIKENPSWQKGKFKELGLHELIIDHFLISPNSDVREYAITYTRDYSDALTIAQMMVWLESEHSDLQEFALSLLAKKDAREDLGLDTIQKLCLLSQSRDLAKKKLKKGFRPSEIPLEWFKPILFNDDYYLIQFGLEYLKKEFPAKLLTAQWFQSLLQDPNLDKGYYSYMVRDYAIENIEKHVHDLNGDWIKQALLHSNYQWNVQSWVNAEKISTKQLDLDWVKTLFSAEAWRESEWVKQIKGTDKAWLDNFSYPEHMLNFAITYIDHPKRFTPQEIGLDWLLTLLEHPNETCKSYALGYIQQNFNAADFGREAELTEVSSQTNDTASTQQPADNPFEGKSFLFTGKLKNLTRKQAQEKVEQIDGVIAKSVTKKLDYLVVGDEGSPLFSGGKKGSKITKAEALREEGLPIEVISETDWLRMLSEGGAAKADIDIVGTEAGFLRLFRMATDEATLENTRQFAIDFLKHRHLKLGPSMTGEALEGEQVIPRSVYKASLFLPLFEDERANVQRLGIDIARYELRTWSVPATDIFNLCESPHRAVRSFALSALLGSDDPDTKEEYFFAPEELDPELVFALVESRKRQVRYTGMALVEKYYDVLEGDRFIIRLAESPDRDVRTQAVKLLWMRYRNPAISLEWSPKDDHRSKIRPSSKHTTPQSPELLIDFVRAVLFGIPPGRLEKRPSGASKPISNSKAKIHMIELARDLALQDEQFSSALTPLFKKFLGSCQHSESMACLVALTRLEAQNSNATLN